MIHLTAQRENDYMATREIQAKIENLAAMASGFSVK
jgi:hypothetical protein